MQRNTSWVLVAALFAAAPLAAQTQTADARASVTVIAHLSVASTQNMILGSPSGSFASAGVVTSSDPSAQPALWLGSSDPGNNIQVQFTTLPAALTSSSGASVPFSCGSQSGVIS